MKVFIRKNGATTFLLVYGHRSRLDMELLEYIYNHAHEWAVVISVTCGTALCQVEDIPEQNVSYNMASVLRKR